MGSRAGHHLSTALLLLQIRWAATQYSDEHSVPYWQPAAFVSAVLLPEQSRGFLPASISKLCTIQSNTLEKGAHVVPKACTRVHLLHARDDPRATGSAGGRRPDYDRQLQAANPCRTCAGEPGYIPLLRSLRPRCDQLRGSAHPRDEQPQPCSRGPLVQTRMNFCSPMPNMPSTERSTSSVWIRPSYQPKGP